MSVDSPLYLVRHGETDWNLEGRLQGRRDVPLNDVGRVQAAETAQTLRDHVPRLEDVAWVSSPMSRARDTIEIMRTALGLHAVSYRVDPRLQEIGFGQWEGLTWKEVRRLHPGEATARDADIWTYRPPGGESYADVTARVAAWLGEIDRPTVMVAHGGVIRALLHLLLALSPLQAAKIDVWQGDAIKVVSQSGRGRNALWLKRATQPA